MAVAGALYGWAADFDMSTYQGVVYEDGVGAMLDIVMNSTDTVVILEIAPCPNVQQMLERNEHAAARARVVSMGGSIRIGYANTSGISLSYKLILYYLRRMHA